MLGRFRAWWNRPRGKGILALFGGPGDDDGAGVREPRRPKQPSLSGAVALKEPGGDDQARRTSASCP
jgi:hypothetical protein